MTVEELGFKEFVNAPDDGLFPNYTDKDIWVSGFVHGYKLGLIKEKDRLMYLVKLYRDPSNHFSRDFDSFIESIEQNIIDIENVLKC